MGRDKIDTKNKNILLIHNPYNNKISDGIKEKELYRDKIQKNKYELIYVRGVTETSLWNAGVWFNANKSEEVIEDMVESDTSTFHSKRRPHVICPFCSEEFNKGDIIKSYSRECQMVKRIRRKTYKDLKKFKTANIIGKFMYHKDCELDIINEIKELEGKAVVRNI